MTEYYYQIKVQKNAYDYGMASWAFPPIFVGKVVACDKIKAKCLVEDMYGKKFPLRVLKKALESNEFLLSLKEIGPDDHHIKRLFELRKCKQCSNEFRIIDKYNDTNCHDKGPGFCSSECNREYSQVQTFKYCQAENLKGSRRPVIYRITNKKSQMCYIGKTTQAFTLRWYQHFFHSGDCKFHRAIKESKITDWEFEVVEMVSIPGDIKTVEEIESLIRQREIYHIKQNDSVLSGYNTV